MAIDKHRCQKLLTQIDELFQNEFLNNPAMPKMALDWVKEKILGEAFKELRRLVDESRPPVFYLVGRSGHGKSSLINALANQEVAPVGRGGEPATAATTPYRVQFPERYADWLVDDSRGIFEITAPAGAARADSVTVAREDILSCNPDIVLHVIAIPEVRALGKDVEVMRTIQEQVRKKKGAQTPVVVVLTKADTLGRVREWPPEQFPAKATEIESFVEVMAKYGTDGRDFQPIRPGALFHGCQILGDSHFLYVVPVNVPPDREDRWNVDLLIDTIGGELPYGARLQFYQALQRKELLRQISTDVIRKFSGLAGLIGTAPIPVADILVLTPLQMLMIAVIAGLSCKEPSLAVASQYMAACGASAGAGLAIREGFRALLKFLPIIGNVAAGGIASAGTWAIGKSAEAYFFAGEVRKPEEFKDGASGLDAPGTTSKIP
jgi:uncharacterized protein (DUF697 family)/predicted GTPase